MDCVICHGKEIEKTKIREEIKAGSDIVYVSINIPRRVWPTFVNFAWRKLSIEYC